LLIFYSISFFATDLTSPIGFAAFFAELPLDIELKLALTICFEFIIDMFALLVEYGSGFVALTPIFLYLNILIVIYGVFLA